MGLWSAAAWSLWGKISRDGDEWLPLVVHLQDTAAIAALLWDEWVPLATRNVICSARGFSQTEGRVLVSWLAGIHDLGKASPDFAWQARVPMPALLGRMRDEGLECPRPETSKIGHGTVGQSLLTSWLVHRHGCSPILADSFSCVVGGHHGVNPANAQLQRVELEPTAVGDARWNSVRDEILTTMAALTGADRYLEGWMQHPLPRQAQMLLSGIVIVADWMASNQELLPYADPRPTQERVAWALKEINLAPPWVPKPAPHTLDELLHDRFPSLTPWPMRPVQKAMVAAAREASKAPLMIVEAPMGNGKTEGAFLATEELARRFGAGGVFIGLPTMATANPMFERALGWLRNSIGPGGTSVSLAHSKAALNDSYAGLMRASWHGQVYDEELLSSAVEAHEGGTRVVSWLSGRKKAGLANHVVGTVDQSLFAALKAKHVSLRHLGLAGKVVIIDEVHASDEYMRVYLKRVLAWLGAYGTPTILMSATLPPGQRDEFLKAYAEGAGHEADLTTSHDDRYPRVTVYDGELSTVPMTAESRTTAVQVAIHPDEIEAVLATLDTELVEGGCVGVVCNTVSRAQELFGAIKERFGEDVTLLHSRFMAPHRASREAELVRRLGPGSAKRPHRLVVVGTQVLEQSLDIDFDLMITDLAPVDLLLQRIGRLHRHDRAGRPVRLQEARCLIRGVLDWTESPPTPVQGSQAVYGLDRLLRSAAVLRDPLRECAIAIPQDIPRLVRLAFDPALVPPIGWEDVWSRAERREAANRLKLIEKARTFLLDEPDAATTLNGLVNVQAPDPDTSEAQGRSQVRDSGEGLEVIALWRDGEGLLRLPEDVGPHSGMAVPVGLPWCDEALGRSMAACTLRLPQLMCQPWVIDRVIASLERQVDYSGWQTSRWISGQLVVAFDPNGIAMVDDFELHYDIEGGLRVIQPAR